MKPIIKYLFLYLVLHLPLISHSNNIGEVVFVRPDTDELWISHWKDTRTARQIYQHSHWIFELAVQTDGPYIVIVSDHDAQNFLFDAYLIDRNDKNAGARNLTQKRFDEVNDIDISHNGDIIFTNRQTGIFPHPVYGVYLIPNQELRKRVPKVHLLIQKVAFQIEWFIDGEHIVYDDLDNDINIYNVFKRKKVLHEVNLKGKFPTISPDGNRLAFIDSNLEKVTTIKIISIKPIRLLQTITPIDHSTFMGIKWTPDGSAIVYTVSGIDHKTRNYRASLNGGPHEEILKIDGKGPYLFDWNSIKNFSVEPKNKLTTHWGKLKKSI